MWSADFKANEEQLWKEAVYLVFTEKAKPLEKKIKAPRYKKRFEALL